ncbi:MAG TPA: TraM recognition domain-containing protein [Bdellovibrionota bacterium]|nr:TraM recognition domain-containing protein [Bdellovibrionota bacterium]
MTEAKKASGEAYSLLSGNLGIAILAVIGLAIAYRWASGYVLMAWRNHPILLIGLAVGAIVALLGLAAAWIWNRRVEQAYDESITGPEINAVRLGKDEEGTPVYLKQRFRTMHAQVIGTTSAGKTESVILPWAIHDIENGSGLLIIDGKSDSAFLEKLYAYVVKAGREKDFRLFSLANLEASHTFNPLMGGGPAEIVERVFSSFRIENEYYRNVQYKVFLLLVRLVVGRGMTSTFALLHHLLTDTNLLSSWAAEASDSALRQALAKLLGENPKDRSEKTSGLETFLSHFAIGEYATLFNSEKPDIQFDRALAESQICYFQLPSMYLPFLAEATGKLVLQSFQNAVSKRHIGKASNKGQFFSCFLDDFQDYIYEGFGSLLNKSRSANIGVVFSHQAIGDLDKVSPAFTNVVLTNTNIKCVMRTSDPETSDYFARSFGTEKAEKMTERRRNTVLGQSKTGEGSVREVEQYVIHPNEIRGQGLGRGIVTIPHAKGMKFLRVAFDRREDLPAVPIPTVQKAMPEIEATIRRENEKSNSATSETKPNTIRI